jgi:hypothetical protein
MNKYLLAKKNGMTLNDYSTVMSDNEVLAKKIYTNLHNVTNPSQIIVICKY